MPILIVVLSVAAFVIWRLWARDRAQAEMANRLDPVWNRVFRRRPCRWERRGGRGALTEFRCDRCGVTAYSGSPKGPRECKRGLVNRL